MEGAFAVGWWLWAPLCAWLSRYVVVRVFEKRLGRAAYFVAYGVWIVSVIAGLIFVQWTGMQFYGFDRSDPWQLAGWIVLFVSPFGLPTLFGAPVIFALDLIRFVAIERRKTSKVSASRA